MERGTDLENHVTILFVGDVYFGQRPYLSLAPEVMQSFKSADLVIANQEGPITDYDKAIGGKCCLKSSPETADILRIWGVDVVSLANNHIFDYGWEGFEQTRQQLDKSGIRYLGAGKNLKEACAPLIVNVNGIKLGLLAYSWEFVQTTCATEDSYGCAPLDKELMVKQIHDLKNQVDHVIVLPHWGYCEYAFPTPEQIELGRTLIEEGATAIIGHHSHVTQGISIESDSLIAYSLGNFAFAEYSDRGRPVHMTNEQRKGIILKMELAEGKITSHDVLYKIQKQSLVQIDYSQQSPDKFKQLCHPLGMPNYTRFWRKIVRQRMVKRILYWANILNWRYIRKETLIGALLMLKGMLKQKGQ